MVYFFIILFLIVLVSYFFKKIISYPQIEITVERRNLSKTDFDELLNFTHSTKKEGVYLIFDTETTGLIKSKKANPQINPEKFPYLVQISWMLFDSKKELIEQNSFLIKQLHQIPVKATEIHKITTEQTLIEGSDIQYVLKEFQNALKNTKYLVAHNFDFDWKIILAEYTRNNINFSKTHKVDFCTMKAGVDLCKIPLYGKEGEYKYPNLQDLFHKCFFPEVKYLNMPSVFHNANFDTSITAKCFFKIIEVNPRAEYELH